MPARSSSATARAIWSKAISRSAPWVRRASRGSTSPFASMRSPASDRCEPGWSDRPAAGCPNSSAARKEKQAFRDAPQSREDRVRAARCRGRRAGRRQVAALLRVQGEAGGDWTVLEAFSVSHGKGSSYLPVIELLHGYFGIVKGDEPAIRRDKVAKRDRRSRSSLSRRRFPISTRSLRSRTTRMRLAGMDPQLRRSRTLRGRGSASADRGAPESH